MAWPIVEIPVNLPVGTVLLAWLTGPAISFILGAIGASYSSNASELLI